MRLPITMLALSLAAAAQPPASEVLYYLGDPQIGFGPEGWEEDVKRFSAAAQLSLNGSGVVVAGDLVNVWNNQTLTDGFDSIWPMHFHSRDDVHLVPGNHDINSEATTSSGFISQLSHYRQTWGQNYHSFRSHFAEFVLVDSESLIVSSLGLNGTTDPFIVNETETQWDWLEVTLEKSQSTHKVIVTHHPPFLTSEDEAHQYFNMPLAPRRRFMALARRFGVQHILCGHTHTTTSRTTTDGIHIYTVAGTARAFDHHGCGYMTLSVNSTTLQAVYHPLNETHPELPEC